MLGRAGSSWARSDSGEYRRGYLGVGRLRGRRWPCSASCASWDRVSSAIGAGRQHFYNRSGLFNALNGLGGGGQLDTKTSANANVALYSTFAVMAFFAG